MAISTYLTDVWSAIGFGDPELSGYAEIQMRQDTRLGVQALAGLSLVMLFVAIPLVRWALRESTIVIGLTYLLLTSSLITNLFSVDTRIRFLTPGRGMGINNKVWFDSADLTRSR